MRTMRLTLVSIGALVLVMGLASITPAEAPDLGPVICHEFDREECLRECRWTYLGTPYGLDAEEQWRRGGSRGPGRWAYYSCVQDCEKRSWKDFDRNFEDN